MGLEAELEAETEAARAYEALLVPALFGEWASKVADAAALRPGHRVLDVACGTGVLSREARARVGPRGSVTGLDPGRGMLAVAAELDPEVRWQAGRAEELPFEDAAFDRVVSQFGLMFFREPARALREMLRVVEPEGRVTLAVWDAIEQLPAYAASAAILDELAGAEAADCVRAPFALGDAARVRGLIEEAGGRVVAQETPVGEARFPSVRSMMEADLRGWLPLLGVTLDEALIERILVEAEAHLAGLVTPSGELVFETSAHVFTLRR